MEQSGGIPVGMMLGQFGGKRLAACFELRSRYMLKPGECLEVGEYLVSQVT